MSAFVVLNFPALLLKRFTIYNYNQFFCNNTFETKNNAK